MKMWVLFISFDLLFCLLWSLVQARPRAVSTAALLQQSQQHGPYCRVCCEKKARKCFPVEIRREPDSVKFPNTSFTVTF